MLREQPADRPDIEEVLRQASAKADNKVPEPAHLTLPLGQSKIPLKTSDKNEPSPFAGVTIDAERRFGDVQHTPKASAQPEVIAKPPRLEHESRHSHLDSGSHPPPHSQSMPLRDDELYNRFPAVGSINRMSRVSIQQPPSAVPEKSVGSAGLSDAVSKRLTDKIFAESLKLAGSPGQTDRGHELPAIIRPVAEPKTRTELVRKSGLASSQATHSLDILPASREKQRPNQAAARTSPSADQVSYEPLARRNHSRSSSASDLISQPGSRRSLSRGQNRIASAKRTSTAGVESKKGSIAHSLDRMTKRRSGPELSRMIDSRLPAATRHRSREIMKGRFNDAFRRFESNADSQSEVIPESRYHSGPENQRSSTLDRTSKGNTQITEHGNQPEDRRSSADTPEARRDSEREQLVREERRVEAAMHEHQQRVLSRHSGQPKPAAHLPLSSRAASIQQEVLSSVASAKEGATMPHLRPELVGLSTAQAADRRPTDRASRPPPPRKPPNLKARPRSMAPGSGLGSLPGPENESAALASESSIRGFGRSDEGPRPAEDWEADFSRRFPSLGHIEMVETEIDLPP